MEQRASIAEASAIACTSCQTSFDVSGGIPILLDAKTRASAEAHADKEPFETYHRARHGSAVTMQYYDYWCADLLSRVPPRKYRRVVELMAGGAELSRRAVGFPRPIVAIDVNHRLLALSREEIVPGVIPVCASAAQLPFEDASIDLVVIQGGLHHVRTFVADVVREIGRCLMPGGVLVASEPRNDNPVNWAVRRAFYHLHPTPEADEEDGFTHREMRTLMQEAGLRLEQYEPFAYLGYMLIGNTDIVPFLSRMGRNRLSSALIELDRRCAKVPLVKDLAWASQIVACKPA